MTAKQIYTQLFGNRGRNSFEKAGQSLLPTAGKPNLGPRLPKPSTWSPTSGPVAPMQGAGPRPPVQSAPRDLYKPLSTSISDNWKFKDTLGTAGKYYGDMAKNILGTKPAPIVPKPAPVAPPAPSYTPPVQQGPRVPAQPTTGPVPPAQGPAPAQTTPQPTIMVGGKAWTPGMTLPTREQARELDLSRNFSPSAQAEIRAVDAATQAQATQAQEQAAAQRAAAQRAAALENAYRARGIATAQQAAATNPGQAWGYTDRDRAESERNRVKRVNSGSNTRNGRATDADGQTIDDGRYPIDAQGRRRDPGFERGLVDQQMTNRILDKEGAYLVGFKTECSTRAVDYTQLIKHAGNIQRIKQILLDYLKPNSPVNDAPTRSQYPEAVKGEATNSMGTTPDRG